MKKRTPITFDRLVVLFNPRSSNADKVTYITAALEKAYLSKIIVKTVRKTETENTKLLVKTLQPHDVLIVCGGDGTISSIVASLTAPDVSADIRRTPIALVGTGRMNDLARMLNGKHADNPLFILKNGRQTEIYPLQCVCTPLDSKRAPLIKTAIYNVGFGYSGTGSILLNDPAYRAHPQIQKPVTRPMKFIKDGLDILKNAEYFDITIRGKRRALLDITATNGHIFYGYWRVPVRLSQRQFYLTMVDDKSLPHTVRLVTDMATKRFFDGQTTTSATFILHQPGQGHVGGEIFTPPTPCRVTITHHAEAIIMLATSPKA